MLPFPIRGVDVDNGSEFINGDIIDYCTQNSIDFTRGRPYHKNDQAHVEERNGAVVRRLVGYDRYAGEEARRALFALYEVVLVYQNYFQPCLKLATRDRNGARVTKRYDSAQTPLQRLLGWNTLSCDAKERQKRQFRATDPVSLLGQLQCLQEALHAHAWSVAAPAPSIPLPSTVTLDAIRSHRNTHTLKSATALPAGPPVTPQDYRRAKKPRKKAADPIDLLWAEIEPRLNAHPYQAVGSLFAGLQRDYPGIFPDERLASLQRHVRAWRRSHGTRPSVASPAGQHATVTGKVKASSLWREALALLEADPFLSSLELVAALQQQFPAAQISERTLRRYLKEWRAGRRFNPETGTFTCAGDGQPPAV